MKPSFPNRRRAAAALAALLAASAAAADLGEADRQALYSAAGLQAQGGAYLRGDCPTPLRPSVEAVDLDGDGRAEALLYLGPSRCFEQTLGGNVGVFVRDAEGRWVERLGYAPGVEVVPQTARHLGMPDLGVASPGGCMPIFRWNGTRYDRIAQKALQPGGCQFRE